MALVVAVFGLRSPAGGQTLTSYYELKLRSATTDRLVPGKNVDLYMAGTATKVYDLTESTTTPGVYYHAAVVNGMYDIYVNTGLWKEDIWIGANKVTLISNLFKFTPDSLNLPSGVVTASKFRGDGSQLTGISGAGGVSNTGDTNIGADTDDNGTGQIFFNVGAEQRGSFLNNGIFLVGFDTTDYIPSSKSIIVTNGIVSASAEEDASTLILAPNVAGTNWLVSYHTGSGTNLPINIVIGLDAVAYFDANNNFGVAGQATFGTNAVNVLAIPNGTAPATSPANIIQIYSEDVSGSAEFKVRNEAGIVTVLSKLVNFIWSKSGEATRSDSIRFVQGSNVTLTRSGNALTIAAETPNFQWNKSGSTVKNDSLRFIQGSNVTLTQTGNTLTIAANVAGSGWQLVSTEVELIDPTNEVVIGGTVAINSAKVTLDGDADQEQLLIPIPFS